MNGTSNSAYEHDNFENENATRSENVEKSVKGRDEWGKDIEFLFSCIALSVGLGKKLIKQQVNKIDEILQEIFGASRLWHLR